MSTEEIQVHKPPRNKLADKAMQEAYVPSTLVLSSSLSQPAVIESSIFAGKLRLERDAALNQVDLIDAEIAALTTRRSTLMTNVAAAEAALVHLSPEWKPEGEQP